VTVSLVVQGRERRLAQLLRQLAVEATIAAPSAAADNHIDRRGRIRLGEHLARRPS